MSLNPALPCPLWCDPRCCRVAGPDDVEHRSTPLVWHPAAACNIEISISITRTDISSPRHIETGTERTLLLITESGLPCTEIDLTPADSRLLMAGLGVSVEQLEVLLAGVTR